MPLILTTGYEDAVRSKLGIRAIDLPDSDINQPLILDLAENVVMKRVPACSTITDTLDLLYLQSAVVSYICYLLAPSMSRRLNIEVTTIDTKWKKEKVDWAKRAEEFLADFENSLSQITSVEVVGTENTTILMIAKASDS